MKISIITVCYNSASTIEKTILSIISQTYSNIEYIVIDGGSKDNTINILNEYKTNIDYMVSESDDGLYDAMNKGINKATGDVIGILNSDDTFNSNTIIQEIADFHKINSIDASVGNIVQHNQNGKIIRTYSSKRWQPLKLKMGYMPPHPSIFIKKDIYEKLGAYRLDFKIGADYELITRFFLKNNITWKYSGITTTSMLIGGISSSGFSSYKMISKEIIKALRINNVSFYTFKIYFRIVWKIKDLFI